MRRLTNILIFSGFVLIFIIFTLFIILIKTRELPTARIQAARNAISNAKQVRAHIFLNSKKYFYQAESLYDSAMSAWGAENCRSIIVRDYKRSFLFADSAKKLARTARGKAIKGSAELKRNLIGEILILKEEANFYEPFFRKLPLSDSILINQSKGRIILTEAEISYNSEDYVNCSDFLVASRQLLLPAHLFIEELLGNYFLKYPDWKDLAVETVQYSKNKRSYAVLVDKFARECILYYCGKPKYHFPVELGKNWIGDKHYKGDKATPEGLYKIIDKKEGRHTSYYKALLINYPNDEDIAQFNEEVKRGSIRKSSHIGGHIEIHGNGGKGIDWTEGCIALSDNAMDQLYRFCRSGTPVAIVGSLKPLHEILR
jgi:hypothetical protein